MMFTKALVSRSPRITSQIINAKKRTTKSATDAGKDTELNPMSELTPKHAKRMINTPIGT